MKALALDEFALEMRLHFIGSTLDALERFQASPDFFSEMASVLDEWISEGRSNHLVFFSGILILIKSNLGEGALKDQKDVLAVAKVLREYLQILKNHEDSEILSQRFQDSFLQLKNEKTRFYLQCVSHSQRFIVPVESVIEIVSQKKIFPLPWVQTGVCGLMGFRGQGIPVIHLGELGFKQATDTEEVNSCFVVCKYKDSYFALAVRRTEEVIELAASQFQKCSDSSLLSPVVDSFAIREEQALMLLEIGKVVDNA